MQSPLNDSVNDGSGRTVEAIRKANARWEILDPASPQVATPRPQSTLKFHSSTPRVTRGEYLEHMYRAGTRGVLCTVGAVDNAQSDAVYYLAKAPLYTCMAHTAAICHVPCVCSIEPLNHVRVCLLAFPTHYATGWICLPNTLRHGLAGVCSIEPLNHVHVCLLAFPTHYATGWQADEPFATANPAQIPLNKGDCVLVTKFDDAEDTNGVSWVFGVRYSIQGKFPADNLSKVNPQPTDMAFMWLPKGFGDDGNEVEERQLPPPKFEIKDESMAGFDDSFSKRNQNRTPDKAAQYGASSNMAAPSSQVTSHTHQQPAAQTQPQPPPAPSFTNQAQAQVVQAPTTTTVPEPTAHSAPASDGSAARGEHAADRYASVASISSVDENNGYIHVKVASEEANGTSKVCVSY